MRFAVGNIRSTVALLAALSSASAQQIYAAASAQAHAENEASPPQDTSMARMNMQMLQSPNAVLRRPSWRRAFGSRPLKAEASSLMRSITNPVVTRSEPGSQWRQTASVEYNRPLAAGHWVTTLL
jgi:hypothetical protein